MPFLIIVSIIIVIVLIVLILAINAVRNGLLSLRRDMDEREQTLRNELEGRIKKVVSENVTGQNIIDAIADFAAQQHDEEEKKEKRNANL